MFHVRGEGDRLPYDVAHLQSLASSLGRKSKDFAPSGQYTKDPECREVIQDLLRFLRNDTSDGRLVTMQLHAWNIVEKDLIPLILTYHVDHGPLVMEAIKLLVFLTLPCERNEPNSAEQFRCLRSVVEALLTRQEVFTVLLSRFSEPLERYERNLLRASEEDSKMIQLFVTLVRNLLFGATMCQAHGISDDGHLKDQFFLLFFDLRLSDLFLQMAKDARKKPFADDSTILLEVFHLLFENQSPTKLVSILEQNHVPSMDGKRPKQKTYEEAPGRKQKICQLRHGRFGGLRSMRRLGVSPSLFQTSSECTLLRLSRHYFGHLNDMHNSAFMPSSLRVQRGLSKLALDLSSGGFNEIMLASWNHLRHRQLEVTEEADLCIKNFLYFGHFFVKFTSLRIRSSVSMVRPNSATAAVSNLLDKHMFLWLQRTWENFDIVKNFQCKVPISCLILELLLLMEAAIALSSSFERLACVALANEVLLADSGGRLFFFLQTMVKHYDPSNLPFSYLANTAQGLLAAEAVLKQVREGKFQHYGVLFDEKVVSNHLMLLTFRDLNSRELNEKLSLFLREIIEQGFAYKLFTLKTLQILHSIATDEAKRIDVDISKPNLRQTASNLLDHFTRSLLSEDSQVQNFRFVDLVFACN